MKRARSTEDVESEIAELVVEIRGTKTKAEKAAEKADEVHAELSGVQAKLASLSTRDKTKTILMKQREKQLSKELDWLSTREQQLRKELEQLRDEEALLRDEKLLLLKAQLSARPAFSTLHEGGTAMMAQLREMQEQVPAAGEVLRFPAGLLLDYKFSSVYIRSCYGPLFKELKRLTDDEKDIIS